MRIERDGRTFAVAGDRYQRFWAKFSSGAWEPDTLRILNERVGPSTTYLDVGAWIGPTVLYAAHSCRVAHAFEPDPVAFDELNTNLALNPQIRNLSTHRLFVGRESGRVRMGPWKTPGDSMSSALFAGGARDWEVESITLDKFAERHRLEAPIFMKMDIEGGEYSLVPGLRTFVMRYRPTILMSLHPFFLASTIAGQSMRNKLERRAKLIAAHVRLARLLRVLDHVTTTDGHPLRLAVGLRAVVVGRRFAPGDALLAWFDN